MVFTDIAQKALNGFTSNSIIKEDIEEDKSIEEDWNNSLPDGLTLEMVLDNLSPTPFSLKDFTEYLQNTYCYENLLFYQAVIDYKEDCNRYFGFKEDNKMLLPVLLSDGITTFDFSINNKSILSSKESIWFDLLINKFEIILKEFILSDAPREINIPYEVRHQLLQLNQLQQLYHPTLLYPAFNAVIELMRISSFIPFATDPNRINFTNSIIQKKKYSNNIKKQKTSPNSLSTQTQILSNLDLDSNNQHQIESIGFFKKFTNSLKLRSSTSNDLSSLSRANWRQINIPDMSPFKSVSTTIPSYSNDNNNSQNLISPQKN